MKIISTEGESGILFGSTSNSGVNNNIKIDNQLFAESYDFIKNCSVVCNAANVETLAAVAGFNMTLDGKKVEKSDDGGKYRLTTAYYGFSALDNNYPSTDSEFNPINTVEQAKAAGWVYDFATGQKVTA